MRKHSANKKDSELRSKALSYALSFGDTTDSAAVVVRAKTYYEFLAGIETRIEVERKPRRLKLAVSNDKVKEMLDKANDEETGSDE